MYPNRISTGLCCCFLLPTTFSSVISVVITRTFATTFAIAIAGALILHSTPIWGQTTRGEGYDLQLELGLEYRDNPLRTNPRGPSDAFLVPRATFNLFRLGAVWEARGAGFVEYNRSLDNVVSDEFRANLAAVVDREIIPGLRWTFQNVARVEQVDLLAAETVDNRQQTNVFITGPSWQIRPRSAWGGAVDARFINSHAEETDEFNSNRLGLSGAVVRRFDGNRRVSLGAEFTDVRFSDDGQSNFDYQRHDLLARYDSTQARLELNLTGGLTRIEPDQGGSLTEPLARIRAIWTADERRSIQALAVYELTDSVRHLASELDQIDMPFVGGGRLPVGAELFQLSSVEVGWHQRSDRLRWSVTPYYHDYDFARVQGSDFDELGVNVSASLRLTRLMSLRTVLRSERRRFSAQDRRDTDSRASVFLNRRFTPRWSGRIGAIRHQRDSNVDGADNRENMIMAYLTFHAGG